MTWDTSIAATRYTIMIATSSDFAPASIIYNGLTDANSYHNMPLLQFNQTYWWKVMAGNADGDGDYSVAWSFTTGLKVPDLISPPDTSTNQPINLTLTWNNELTGANQYIQVAKDINFTQFIVNDSSQSISSKNLDTLSYYTEYYWRVRNLRNGFQSFWSDTWRFKTTIPTPTTSTPTCGDTGNPLILIISWNVVPNGTTYQFQLSDDNGFSNIIINKDSISDNYITTPDSLKYNTVYYWHVKAKNKDSETPYSDVCKFQTEQKPASVIDNIPAVGYIQAYPNPFSDMLRIDLNLVNASIIKLAIVNIMGEEVSVIANGRYASSGLNQYEWQPDALTQGVYYLRANIDGTILTKEIILLK